MEVNVDTGPDDFVVGKKAFAMAAPSVESRVGAAKGGEEEGGAPWRVVQNNEGLRQGGAESVPAAGGQHLHFALLFDVAEARRRGCAAGAQQHSNKDELREK